MFIQRDVNGARALRSLKTATKETSETLKKLSSGYCVNVAADDAAGLAVSEKMRMQITGLDRAQQNSLEGSRLIQIGDGSLEEIHRMLNRAVELADMSSNGTYEDKVDREALQAELDKLYDEVDRITQSANFNGIKLFQDKGYDYETGNAERRILAMKSMLEEDGEYPPPGFGYMAEPGYQPPKPITGTASAQAQSAQRQVAVVNGKKSADSDAQGLVIRSSTSAKNIAASMQADTMTLNDVLEGTKKGTVSIVYTDSPTKAVVTSAANSLGVPTFPASQQDPDINIGGGNTKKLSAVLEKDIVPRVVNNIMETYKGAFGYLSGKTINIGLEYFDQSASSGNTTLAYVAGATDSSNTQISFTLGVNIGALPTNAVRDGATDDLSGLEATIAHEMIHAFMDQGATAGMFGMQTSQSGNVMTGLDKFPGWFVEGMAQTAGGANDRLIHTMQLLSGPDTAPTALTGSTLTDLFSGANGANFKLGSGTTDSEYGTGYLACMYLGAVVGGYDTSNPNSPDLTTAVKSGLNQILDSIIGGASLDSTINVLTQDFSSASDFQTQFNNGTCQTLDRDAFVTDLCNAILGGRGGLASDNGQLDEPDLIKANGDYTNPNISGLFKLNTSTGAVTNNQRPDNVLSGGALSSNGLSPSNKLPSYGELSFKDSDVINMKYQQNGNDHKFTFSEEKGNVSVISMKNAGAASLGTKHDIVLQDKATIALDNAQLTGNGSTVTVEKNATIKLTGNNTIGDLKFQNSGASITFSGSGTDTVNLNNIQTNGSNTIHADGVLVNVGNSGLQGATVTLQKGGALLDNSGGVANVQDSSGSPINLATFPTTGNPPLLPFTDIASIHIKNGGQASVNGATGLYLDPSKDGYIVTFTDSNNNVQSLKAVKDANGDFYFQRVKPPFTVKDVSGADVPSGSDWEYDFQTDTLLIKSKGPLTISGGTTKDQQNGIEMLGRIQLADNIAPNASNPLELTLDGVECDISDPSVQDANECAFNLGKGNNVVLKLNANQKNTFKSGEGWAGISLGSKTTLQIDTNKINGDVGNLEAFGGSNGAGIGRSLNDDNTNDETSSSITITGGNITAVGGTYGAGIGATSNFVRGVADGRSIGDITITGGNITAVCDIDISDPNNPVLGRIGEAAGIGGGLEASVGNITIEGNDTIIRAETSHHGAGIGGGHRKTGSNGAITISGGAKITAISHEHGTGIGAGCQGDSGKITIKGNVDIIAKGGNDGAGLGSSWEGKCDDIEILDDANVTATGGNYGAGIGAGSYGSNCGDILINTDGTVTAAGGTNGVGIGSGYSSSRVGDITITKGTVDAKGSDGATGIGAGVGSTSGSITIGEANKDNKVVVTAIGGRKSNSGNIVADADTKHTDYSYDPNDPNQRPIKILGTNTTVRPGDSGEGIYSTSGAIDKNNNPIYSYPLNLFDTNRSLDAAQDDIYPSPPFNPGGVIPDGSTQITITANGSQGSKKEWKVDLSHAPLDNNYDFIWMEPQDQTITIEYVDPDPNVGKQTVQLPLLKWYPDAGVWRTVGKNPPPPPPPDPPPPTPPVPDPPKEVGSGGIVLQIGTHTGEFLEVPTFYLSANSLKLDRVNISTQDNALRSIEILKNSINRVSDVRGSYGALYNRLEHNINNLGVMKENMTDAESAIRDADIAKEMMKHTKNNILMQSSQAMLAQSNQNMSQVLQFLRA